MKEKNKGITLITLVITIVVLLILVGVTLQGVLQGTDETKDNNLLTELVMIQQAIVERYSKYKLTKDESLLVGTVVDFYSLPAQVERWKLTSAEIGTDNVKKYRKLNGTDLEQIGIKVDAKAKDNYYIINYFTGEVFNYTKKRTKSGELLYRTL